MPYDEILAYRVRQTIDDIDPFGLVEKKMFGGIAYMLRGNLACGVHKDGLIVRVGDAGNASALAQPGARPFDLTGRPMRGWVYVDGAACQSDADLRAWLMLGVNFAATLPAK